MRLMAPSICVHVALITPPAGTHEKRTGRTAYCDTFTRHTFHDMTSWLPYNTPIDL
ncbi:conserved domain protein [Actinomyces sp. oral taxon 175 str. F0384]|nr:conserved domain protein [Actinomyces sp. oral taxon 175 str. F0384]